MDNKTSVVLKGWLDLSSSQKKEFLDAINKYEEASEMRKSAILEDLRKTASAGKVSVGPYSSQKCPCCGR